MSTPQPHPRRIMHIDMDAFFASVEMLDNPEWRGKPVIVGKGDRGVVSAASYEARAFGVHSAMPVFQARRLCPHGVFTGVHMHRYAEVSHQVMEVLGNFSPRMEQASVDEAYLDVTGTERLFGTSLELARMLKKAVREATGCTCSVGIAPIKFLAKIASDQDKPDGIFIIEPDEVAGFLETLPVRVVPGVGKRSQEILKQLGVVTCGDVLERPQSFWEKRLGKGGASLYRRAQGIDDREVVPWTEPKSESAENTLSKDTSDMEELRTWLLAQSERVARGLRKYGKQGRTVTLKVKFSDFQQITRAKSLGLATDTSATIYETACVLLDEVGQTTIRNRKVRLIGVGVSNFGQESRQLSLSDDFDPAPDEERRGKLDQAMERLREQYGKDAVVRGRLFGFKGRR